MKLHIGTVLVLAGLALAVGLGWKSIVIVMIGAAIFSAGIASYEVFPNAEAVISS